MTLSRGYLPVNWPDGTSFGTICVLSKAPRTPTALNKQLMTRLRAVVEMTLELLVTQEQLRFSATHDALTGALDHTAFLDLAARFVTPQIAESRSAWIIFWDIDDFKAVNDQLGHALGDGVLKEVADRASNVLRAGDYLGRLGGDEFAVLVSRARQEDVETLADRLMSAIGEVGVHQSSGWTQVSVSCGITAVQPKDTVDSWIERADYLMYRAKHGGKNRYSL